MCVFLGESDIYSKRIPEQDWYRDLQRLQWLLAFKVGEQKINKSNKTTKTNTCKLYMLVPHKWCMTSTATYTQTHQKKKYQKQVGHAVYSKTLPLGLEKAFICSQTNKWKDANDFQIWLTIMQIRPRFEWLLVSSPVTGVACLVSRVFVCVCVCSHRHRHSFNVAACRTARLNNSDSHLIGPLSESACQKEKRQREKGGNKKKKTTDL